MTCSHLFSVRRLIRCAITSLLCFAATLPASAQSFLPDGGLWWNPSASGHGYHVAPTAGSLAVVWYTYDGGNQPTWYLAAAPLTGSNWSAELLQFSWDGARSAATGKAVGSISIAFESAGSAQVNWNIHGANGSERIERYVFSTAGAQSGDVTGLWFDAGTPGYGLTVVTQGSQEAAVLYFYDASGNPRWVLGSAPYGGGNTSVPVAVFSGPCPNCTGSTAVASEAGSISHDFSRRTSGSFSAAVTLPASIGGTWTVAETSFSMLSDAPLGGRRVAKMIYDWDNNGITDAVRTYSYDASGRLVREEYVYVGDGTPDADLFSAGMTLTNGTDVEDESIEYGYDALGRLVTMRIAGPSSVSDSTYTYEAGRLVGAEDVVVYQGSTVVLNDDNDELFAQLRSLYPNMSEEELQRLVDSLVFEPVQIETPGGSGTVRWSLSYSNNRLSSFRMEVADSSISAFNELFYDSSNRVVSRVETTDGRVTTYDYGYDSVGRFSTTDTYNAGPRWVSSDVLTYGGSNEADTWLITSSLSRSLLVKNSFDRDGKIVREDYDIDNDGSTDLNVTIEWESASCRRTVFWAGGAWATGDLQLPPPFGPASGFVYLPGCGAAGN